MSNQVQLPNQSTSNSSTPSATPPSKPTVPIAVISSNFGSGVQNNNTQYINPNVVSNIRSAENKKS